MINFSYKKTYIIQAILLVGLAIINFIFFEFDLFQDHKELFVITWCLFIIGYMFNIKLILLPRATFLESIEELKDKELDWDEIEDVISQRNKDFKKISNQFKSENSNYQFILDSLHDQICIIDKNKKIHYSNASFNKLFKVNSAQNISLIEIIRNFDFQQFITNSLQETTTQTLRDFCFDPLAQENLVFYKIKVFPLETSSRFLCVMHDVSERKKADIVREEFVANFSHEVRTPITVIDGQIQLIAQEMSDDSAFKEKYSGAFERIAHNCKRLTTLFNDLLKLSSIEKKSVPVKESIELQPMVETIFQDLTQERKQDDFKLEFDLQTPTLFADYDMLEHVVINLIENALKYSKGAGSILVKSYTKNNRDIVEFTDNGIGISNEHLLRIFERFYRVDASRSSIIPGSGLGLSIVRHIILKHNGKVSVESKLGKGSTFIISLPSNPIN